MPIPDTLAHQIELFRTTGRVAILDPDGFAEPSWVSLFLGLGLMPESYDPFVDHIDAQALLQHFVRLRQAITQTVGGMGLPNVMVGVVAAIIYKNLGVSNEDIALYTSQMYLPWVLKPLWAPLLEPYRSKRWWVISMLSNRRR